MAVAGVLTLTAVPQGSAVALPVRTATFLEAGPLVFKGRTTQGKRVHFVDTTGSLTKFNFGIVYVCNDPRHTRFPLRLSNGASPVAVRRGKFHLVTQGVRISGRIRGKRSAGTAGPLSYKTNGYVCTMPRVRWSASAR
jgi:hypothetical protein